MPDADVKLVIGSKNTSSWSLRPWLALRMGGIAFEEILIQLDRETTQGEIAKYTKAGLVPVLLHGDLAVWDSLAIIEYAHELAPEAGLWPEDRAARARARSVSAEMHSGFYPLRKTMPMAFAQDLSPHAPDPKAAKNIARIIALWEEMLERAPKSGPGGGPFLFGRFCAADAMYAPVVSRFRTYGVALEGRARDYAQAVWDLEPMREWRDGAGREVEESGGL